MAIVWRSTAVCRRFNLSRLRANWSIVDRCLVQLRVFSAVALSLVVAGCEQSAPTQTIGADADGHSPATAHTRDQNAAKRQLLARLNNEDMAAASRGLIAAAPATLTISGPGDMPAWDLGAYQFIAGEAPDTVNPSLWRQERLNNLAGLYQVAPGIYQVRGFDLANMTLIEGERGWIVVDPLTNQETAAAALTFAFEHLPERPVTAVIFTHSHIDHFGGVFGVVSHEAINAGQVEIVAPLGFMEEATSEMVLAGRVMSRRADFMYGRRLARSARGHVGSGLGKQPALGTLAIAEPTLVVTDAVERHRLDGVDVVFKNVPGSEAPAEFIFYLPKQQALCGAELVSRNLHNLYTLRGAKVRDALRWSGYIDEAIHAFPDTEVIFNSHHWPVFGQVASADYLTKQRDMYRYIHDQTLRMAGQGMTAAEIAEQLTLPESLSRDPHIRDYYGTVRHNVRAVYQFYFGWYDGNPAHLDQLPEAATAERYIELMGGAEAVMTAAQAAFEQGDYRWSAELLNRLVFAQPDYAPAKALLAETYDQLGYVAESGPWRDVYLSAAYELRHDEPEEPLPSGYILGLLRETPVERILELMAAMLDGPAAEGVELSINFHLTDLDQNYQLRLSNAVLHHRPGPIDADADATLHLSHEFLLRILLREVEVGELLSSDELRLEGSRLALVRLLSLMQPHDGAFPIVTP